MDVFDTNILTPYTFLEIDRGTVIGDVIVDTIESEGVFKLRNGMNSSNDQETKNSNATLHVYPDEEFISTGLVGHGIRIGTIDYEIIGVTKGMNYDEGVEHYRLTLQERDFSQMESVS